VDEIAVDFMDGQLLRYRITLDGHFLLYSVGLDCVDEGGTQSRPRSVGMQNVPERTSDILWPRPATGKEMERYREEVSRVNAWPGDER
jgi:hypothetical protein